MTTIWALTAALAAAGLSAPSHGAGGSEAVAVSGKAEGGRPIVLGRSFEMQSRILKDVRRINVYLPPSYGEKEKTYPVLFLLDGGEKEDFLHISALAQITSAYGQGREVIVVGIEGVDRRHDLTSPSAVAADMKAAPTAGGSAGYRRFLVEEVKPWVAARYRVNGSSALIGESLAGLFVLETFLKAPSSFKDYIAVSPSLWWNGGRLAAEARTDLSRGSFSGRRLWIGFETPSPPADAAERERAVQVRVEAALAGARPGGLIWSVVRLDETHGTIYHPAALAALRTLYGTSSAPP